MNELRAQERQPCEWPGWAVSKWCCPTKTNPACDGCDGRGKGTRWVSVGKLVEDDYASDACGRWGPDIYNYLFTIEKDD